jgi:hypothetical protein
VTEPSSALTEPLPDLAEGEILIASLHTPMPAKMAAELLLAIATSCRQNGYQAFMSGPHIIGRPLRQAGDIVSGLPATPRGPGC